MADSIVEHEIRHNPGGLDVDTENCSLDSSKLAVGGASVLGPESRCKFAVPTPSS